MYQSKTQQNQWKNTFLSKPTKPKPNKRLNKHSHSHTVWCEPPSSSLILESTIVILSPNILKLSIVLERVNRALPFYSVSTLNIIVVRKEQLFSSMELSPPSDRFLRSIVPPHSNFDVVPIVCLDLLDACHVWRLTCVRWSHEHTIPSCPKPQKTKKKKKKQITFFFFFFWKPRWKKTFLWDGVVLVEKFVTSNNLSSASDGVGIQVLFPRSRFGH